MRWVIEIERVDILEVALLSTHMVLPREGHLQNFIICSHICISLQGVDCSLVQITLSYQKEDPKILTRRTSTKVWIKISLLTYQKEEVIMYLHIMHPATRHYSRLRHTEGEGSGPRNIG